MVQMKPGVQVVWADSCAVGCAIARCGFIHNGAHIRNGHVLFCHYGRGYDWPALTFPNGRAGSISEWAPLRNRRKHEMESICDSEEK